MSSPRLAEIAERTGVSVSTVSRVLNDKPGVGEHTRRQVLTALDVLGYDRPSRLRGRAAGLVGLIVPELDNPFFPRFAHEVEDALVRHGYTPVLCSQSLGGVTEDDYVSTLLDHGVAGIVFVSGVHARVDCDTARYRRLVDLGLPIVLVNGFHEDIPAPCVSTDERAAAELAVHHLTQLGHRRIGLAVGQRRYTPVVRREEGFRAAMRAAQPHLADVDLDDLVESTTFTVEGGALAAGRLFDRGATAVVCASDVMALGAVRAAGQRGLAVPDDVSVIGSDDNPLLEFTAPALTTIRQPVGALAAAACRSLLELIGGAPTSADDLRLQGELVLRRSTGPTRLADAGRVS